MIMAFLFFKINHSAQVSKNNLQYCLTRFFVMAYRLPAPHKAGAGFDSLIVEAGSRYISVMRFFCARNSTLPRIMAGRNGGAFALAGFFYASLSTLLRPATMFDSVLARLRKSVEGAAKMAISTRPDFIWRFMQCHGKNIRLHTVTAASEREARACFRHPVWSLLPVSVSGRRAMFKLLITLINYQNGDVRQMIHSREYPTYDDAWRDACRMAYSRNDKQGRLTHKCAVKIMEG